MARPKYVWLSLVVLVVAGFLFGCKSKPLQKNQEELAADQFQPKIYPMQVKGILFSMDIPMVQGDDLQQQQDKFFTLSNEDTENKSMRKYIKTRKSPNENSIYILRTGMSIHHPEHLFDTFLEYKISINCHSVNKYLHCEYKALEGAYSRDLPPSLSLDGTQTLEQMEANEIKTLSLLNTRSITQTEIFNSKLSLTQLQPTLQKNNFSVKAKGSGLSLYKAKLDYNANLTQEKVKSGYAITVSIEVNPIKESDYHSDFVTPFNQALQDIRASVR